jgi:nucleoside triphosphatase
MPDQKYPEPTVGAMIFNPEGQILLVRSHKWKDKYTIPGGHVELGETLKSAVVREAKEETGLDVRDPEFLCFQEFIHGENFWKKRHFIFFDFVCHTEDEGVTLNDEAEEYLWVAPEDAYQYPIDPYLGHALDRYLGQERVSGGEGGE